MRQFAKTALLAFVSFTVFWAVEELMHFIAGRKLASEIEAHLESITAAS